MSVVCTLERRLLGLDVEEVIDVIGKSSDSPRALSSNFFFKMGYDFIIRTIF